MKHTETATEQIIREAFKKGESWGITHSGWFSPSEADTEEKIQEAVKAIKEAE